ncbi:unnamed protein product [Linum trigynum]|uniref:Uncharacterized protein n=1 Tax=Linum trigynum TaxID=586398 RepID=A0AAV2FRY0_9ROSI
MLGRKGKTLISSIDHRNSQGNSKQPSSLLSNSSRLLQHQPSSPAARGFVGQLRGDSPASLQFSADRADSPASPQLSADRGDSPASPPSRPREFSSIAAQPSPPAPASPFSTSTAAWLKRP